VPFMCPFIGQSFAWWAYKNRFAGLNVHQTQHISNRALTPKASSATTAAASCHSFSMYAGDDERPEWPRCERRIESSREAQLYANEQRRYGGDSQLWADLDSERRKKGGKERRTMEEKLIIAVSGFPELYDICLFGYRDNQKWSIRK